MHEYPPQPVDQNDLQENVFDDTEFQNSLQALEARLGIVATVDQIELVDDKDIQHSSSAADSAEDIDSALDAAYSMNRAYDAILEEGDKAYDEAVVINQEHDAKQAAELRQLIDDALIELQQAEKDAKSESVIFKEIKADSRNAEPKAGNDKAPESANASSITSPEYTKAVLAQANVPEPLPGQASADSVTGEVIIKNVFDGNTLTVVEPHIAGEPTVTTYDFDPKSGTLTIKTKDGTVEASMVRNAAGELPAGSKPVKVPPSVSKLAGGATFMLAA